MIFPGTKVRWTCPLFAGIILTLSEDGCSIFLSPVIRELPQSPQPFKDTKDLPHMTLAKSLSTHRCIPYSPVDLYILRFLRSLTLSSSTV